MAAKAGAIVIDNSSAWRMDPDVPLVVPEVNADALRNIPKGIVANPNCSTIQMVVALKPLHDLARIKRVVVCDLPGVRRARGPRVCSSWTPRWPPWARAKRCRPPRPTRPSWPAMCCRTTGRPARKATPRKSGRWSARRARSWATTPSRCRRRRRGCRCASAIPRRSTSSFERPITVEQAREALRRAPGIILVDDLAKGEVPLPLHCEGRDEVFVGRIRRDPTVANGLNLWVVADNLRKGAATNAVQIAEVLVQRGWLARA